MVREKIALFLFLSFLLSRAIGGNSDMSDTKAQVSEWINSQGDNGFVENKGQMTDMNGMPVPFVLYKINRANVDLYITTKGITYVFLKNFEKTHSHIDNVETNETSQVLSKNNEAENVTWNRIDMELKGADIKKENIITEGASTDFKQYFLGHCPDGITDVRTYKKVTIKSIYPGIDWVFYNSSDKGFKYDFIVHPGANSKHIELIYSSATPLNLNKDGSLRIKTELGSLTESAPYTYIGETNKEVKSEFQITSQQKLTDHYQASITFKILPHKNTNSTLVIDPALFWATYYSGSEFESPHSVTTDNAGNVFVTGYTYSANFPVLSVGGYFQGTIGSGFNSDVFLLKFSNAGVLQWSTFYGGTSVDVGYAVGLDGTNNIFVAGYTQSTNFPVQNAGTYYDGTLGGWRDAFILKFNSSGTRLWATHYGGTNNFTEAHSLALDATGNIFVAGFTTSTNFPVQNAGTFFQGTLGGGQDAIILKFDNSGTRLWATHYGGTLDDLGNALTIDASGNVFVVGDTYSSNLPVMTTGTFYQGTLGGPGASDIFILKFSNSGARLWATYYGGSSQDNSSSIAIDPGGNIFIVGNTASSNFPTQNAGTYFDGTLSGTQDAFILKFANSGNRLWASYYGGTRRDYIIESYDALAIDACGNVYFGFSAQANVYTQNACNTGYYKDTLCNPTQNISYCDIFLTRFTNTGKLLWASYVNGNGDDHAASLAVDNSGNLFVGSDISVAGLSTSYATVNPGGGAYFNNVGGGRKDVYILKFITDVPTYTVTQTNPTSCLCNGKTKVSVTCGEAPFSYKWSTGASTLNTVSSSDSITGLCAGIYQVTVTTLTTGYGCESVSSYTLTNTGVNTATINPVSCNSYTLNSQVYSSSGVYTQTLTSALGCDSILTINFALSPSISTYNSINVCAGQSVMIHAVSRNTTGVYTQTFVSSGGCDSISSVTLTVKSVSTHTLNPSSCSSYTLNSQVYSSTGVYTQTLTNALGCDSLLKINLTISPAINTNNNINICSGQTALIHGLSQNSSGVYTQTFVSTSGCDSISSVILAVNSLITTTINPVSCNSYTLNGQLYSSSGIYTQTLSSATGCDSLLTINLTISPTVNTNNNVTICSGQTTVIHGISQNTSGVYTQTFMSVTGCDSISSVTLTVYNLNTLTITPTNLSCNGGNNGSAVVLVSGGIGGYTYSWNNGQTASSATGLIANSYSVTVNDTNGCSVQGTIIITQPAVITASITSTNVSCNSGNNGTAVVVVSGGTGSYTYSWSNSQTSLTATGLIVGVYSVTVTDTNGCTVTAARNITEPAVIVIGITTTSVSCALGTNGTINANVGGGIGPYNYNWVNSLGSTVGNISSLPAGSYTLTVTDANNCTRTATATITQPSVVFGVGLIGTNIKCFGGSDGAATSNIAGGVSPYTYSWSNGATTANITNVTAGIYSLTVTDANGCITADTITLTEPTVFTVSITATTNILCNGGNNGLATVTANGGVLPYTYNWSNGQVTPTAIGLVAGSYTVEVRDANGICMANAIAIITEPAVLMASISAQTDLLCFSNNNGTAIVAANGGTSAYTYAWSNNQANATSTGLIAGVYSVTVTDNNGCSTQTSATITEPPLLTLSLTPTHLLCNNISTGSVAPTVNGGTSPYTYSWSNAETTATATGLAAGGYTLTVTDTNGCSVSQSTILTQPSIVTLTLSSTADHCSLSDGTATVAASGGTPGYNYSWSNGQAAATSTGLAAGVYTVTVTDNNSCVYTGTVNVPAEFADTLQFVSLSNTFCFGVCDGSITVQMSANNYPPYAYTWSTTPTQSAATATGLCAGIYSVTVTDVYGCRDTMDITVNQPPVLTLSLTAVNTLCFGDNTGSATAIAGGGTTVYTYAWSTGANTVSVSGLVSGIYNCIVTDNNGCTATANVQVNDPPILIANITPPSPICIGKTGTLAGNAVGGTPAYTYAWSTGNNTATINPSPAITTTYTLVVTDANGCTTQTSVVLTVNDLPVVTFTSDLTEGCSPLCITFQNTTLNSASQAWAFGDGNTSTDPNSYHCYTDTGKYAVSLFVTDINGCTNTTTINNYITVHPDPVAAFAGLPQPTTIVNPTIYFSDKSLNAVSWQWSFGDVTNGSSIQQNPNYTYTDVGTYQVQLIVANQFGCTDTAYEAIVIDADFVLYIPNTFTPNGDGLNDIFLPQGVGIDIDKFEFWIFDRWGNMIFESTNTTRGWDGRANGGNDIAQQDSYVWLIKLKDELGFKHKYVGHVNLVK